MEYRDYYQILGVSRGATEKEIKSAFRRKAQDYHPDLHPNDKQAEEKFKELNEAYEVLRDADKRATYDRLGSSYSQWQRSGSPGGGFDFSQWAAAARAAAAAAGGRGGAGGRTAEDLSDLFGQGGFSDFFNILFGGAASRQPGGRAAGHGGSAAWNIRGEDQEQSIEITLEEAFTGTQRTLQKGDRRLEVKIPPGARTGTRVRMAGAGGPGQTPGDLFLVVTVKPHSHFRREGDDVHVDLPVDLYTALLGGEVPVPTLTGEVKLTLPPETQAGRAFRLAGQGLPKLRTPTERGDLLAHVVVRIPTGLSDRERALIEELRGLRGAEA
jgi:curved DNA-binding protein